MFTNHIYSIYVFKQDLEFNNLKWLICHKTKPNQTKRLIVGEQDNNWDPGFNDVNTNSKLRFER